MPNKIVKEVAKEIIKEIKKTDVVCATSDCIFRSTSDFRCNARSIVIIKGSCNSYSKKQNKEVKND